jgi:hypothetical protein
MRRVITPVMLALAFAALTSANASAGLFGNLCKSGCDSGFAAEPACGCEAPACGCEVAPSCCDAAPSCKKPGLLARLFAKKSCAAACCEAPSCCAEPVCGCEVVAPACGCEAPAGCDSGCGIKRPGLLSKLFGKKSSCCDSGCAAPACGCEPSCGF